MYNKRRKTKRTPLEGTVTLYADGEPVATCQGDTSTPSSLSISTSKIKACEVFDKLINDSITIKNNGQKNDVYFNMARKQNNTTLVFDREQNRVNKASVLNNKRERNSRRYYGQSNDQVVWIAQEAKKQFNLGSVSSLGVDITGSDDQITRTDMRELWTTKNKFKIETNDQSIEVQGALNRIKKYKDDKLRLFIAFNEYRDTSIFFN